MTGARKFDTDVALDGAMEVFREKGFAATSLKDLETAMGLGRGSIYNAFGDKHALFIAVLERYCEEMETHLREMLAGGPTALEGIRLVVRMAAVECSGNDSRPGCFMGNATSERANCDEAAQEVLERGFARMLDLFTEQLIRSQGEGDFGKDRNPDATARFLIMSMQGMNLMAKAGQPDLLVGIAEEILRALD